jgi:hypothetical protein
MPGVTVNCVPYDWGCLEAGVSGIVLPGLRSIEYGNSVEDEYVKGAGREPLDYTDGQLEPKEVKLTVLESDYRALIGGLGPGYMFKRFPISVSYGYTGQPMIVDQLYECRIKDDAHSHSHGASGLEVSLTLRTRKCIMAGVSPANGRAGEGGSASSGVGVGVGVGASFGI